MRALLVWLLLTAPVLAAEQCVTVDSSRWTTQQQVMKEHLAAWVVQNATPDDRYFKPTLRGQQVCYQDPTVDITKVVTEKALLDRFAIEQAARDAAAIKELAYTAYEQKIAQEQRTQAIEALKGKGEQPPVGFPEVKDLRELTLP